MSKPTYCTVCNHSSYIHFHYTLSTNSFVRSSVPPVDSTCTSNILHFYCLHSQRLHIRHDHLERYCGSLSVCTTGICNFCLVFSHIFILIFSVCAFYSTVFITWFYLIAYCTPFCYFLSTTVFTSSFRF